MDLPAAARAIDDFLRAIGRDPAREPELVGTGARVADAYANDLLSGYGTDTRAMLASGVLAASAPGLVVVRDIPVVTTCPHHLLPALGSATVAMMARDRIVGLGTIVALLDGHARRLTLQEQIGEGVVADLDAVLAPTWVGCRVSLVHGCLVARGERAIGSRVETVASRGATDPETLALLHTTLSGP